jgi:predicted metal-dependent hydrolase
MEYKVIYSSRKTLALSIVDCKLVVRAPYKTPKKKIEEVISKHRNWIDKHIATQQAKNDLTKNLTSLQIKKLKEDARAYFLPKVEYYSKIMGLKYGRITITSASKRFGSCNDKGNICFSYRLMLYPEVAREYVIVHELAHLKEMNHSDRFYSIVASVLPDYKARKRLLK